MISSLFEPIEMGSSGPNSYFDNGGGAVGSSMGARQAASQSSAPPMTQPSGSDGRNHQLDWQRQASEWALGASGGGSSGGGPPPFGAGPPSYGVGPPPTRELSNMARSPETQPNSQEFSPLNSQNKGHQPPQQPNSPTMVSRELFAPPQQARADPAMAPQPQAQREQRRRSPSNERHERNRERPMNERQQVQAAPQAGPQAKGNRTYAADADDLLDQHVAYYFRHHPEVYNRHKIGRKRPGVYELNGREITVEWQYGLLPGEQGFLVALDGPLRQPFADYMSQTEANAEYVTQGLTVNALHAVPLPARMTFDDKDNAYTRLEAMKVAKEQAIIREKAAEYTQMGMPPPQDLRNLYEKTINRKLNPGGNRQRQQGAQMGPPVAMPPMAMPGVPQPVLPNGWPANTLAPQAVPLQHMGQMQASLPGNLFGTPNLMAEVRQRGQSPGPTAGGRQYQQPMFRFS